MKYIDDKYNNTQFRMAKESTGNVVICQKMRPNLWNVQHQCGQYIKSSRKIECTYLLENEICFVESSTRCYNPYVFNSIPDAVWYIRTYFIMNLTWHQQIDIFSQLEAKRLPLISFFFALSVQPVQWQKGCEQHSIISAYLV